MRKLICALLAFLWAAPGNAQQTQSLFASSLNLPVLDGATVPNDCRYPRQITDDPHHYELACVVMARNNQASDIGMHYMQLLSERGWNAPRDMVGSAIPFNRSQPDGCVLSLTLMPADLPGDQQSQTVVIYFIYDPQPRCPSPTTGATK